MKKLCIFITKDLFSFTFPRDRKVIDQLMYLVSHITNNKNKFMLNYKKNYVIF